jgi:hypothetical protein
MATVEIPTDAGNTEYYGYVDTVWPPVATFTSVWAGTMYCTKEVVAGEYRSRNTGLSFNTSVIPDSVTITEAFLKFQVCGTVDAANLYSLEADYYNWVPSDAADYVLDIPGTSIIGTYDLTGKSSLIERLIPLTDLTGINKTGITYIRLGLTDSGTPPGTDSLNYFTFSHNTTESKQARLVVNFDDPPTTAYIVQPPRVY